MFFKIGKANGDNHWSKYVVTLILVFASAMILGALPLLFAFTAFARKTWNRLRRANQDHAIL